MDAAIAGLIGAGIGALTSIAGMWVQAHYTTKREKSKIVMESATAVRAQDISLASLKGGAIKVPPLAAYLHHHSLMSQRLSETTLNEEETAKLFALHIQNSRKLIRLESDWTTEEELSNLSGKPG